MFIVTSSSANMLVVVMISMSQKGNRSHFMDEHGNFAQIVKFCDFSSIHILNINVPMWKASRYFIPTSLEYLYVFLKDIIDYILSHPNCFNLDVKNLISSTKSFRLKLKISVKQAHGLKRPTVGEAYFFGKPVFRIVNMKG